jgi:hypothetical protein
MNQFRAGDKVRFRSTPEEWEEYIKLTDANGVGVAANPFDFEGEYGSPLEILKSEGCLVTFETPDGRVRTFSYHLLTGI